MTHPEFQNQVERLASSYPKGAYPPERIKQIWQLVEELPAAEFGRIVGELIGTMRQAPLLPEFREAVAKVREREWEYQKSQKSNSYDWLSLAHCSRCRGSGTVRAIDVNEPWGAYAFKCNCEFGAKDRRRFPEWQEADKKRFQLVE